MVISGEHPNLLEKWLYVGVNEITDVTKCEGAIVQNPCLNINFFQYEN